MNTLIKSIIVTIFLTIGSTSLFAGSGHSHSVDKDTILRNAKNTINKLVATTKIGESWLESNLLNKEKRTLDFGEEWLISFKNNKVKDTKKQILYVYLTTYGQVKGVNYLGN